MILVFLAITAVFLALLLQRRLCALCVAVSVTWACLLFLSWLGLFDDAILLAILTGQSVTGILYLLRDRWKNLESFQLPLLLTLTILAYGLVTGTSELGAVLFVATIWTAFGTLRVTRMRRALERLAACCGKW